MFTRRTSFFYMTIGSTLLISSQITTAQTPPSGPMFSTPASRSTTGAPILSDPSRDSNTILNSAGGSSAQTTQSPPERSQAPAAPPPNAKKEAFGNWTIECANSTRTSRQCQITGKTASADQKQTILVISIALSSDKKAMLYQGALPLGISLHNKVQISVGEKFKTEIAVSRCTQQGCLLEGILEPQFLEAMKKGGDAKFTVTTPEGSQIPIVLSLEGFSEALSALSSS